MGVLGAVKQIMLDGEWHSMAELTVKTGGRADTVSASVRALRNKENGGHTVDKQLKDGAWHYRIAAKTPAVSKPLPPTTTTITIKEPPKKPKVKKKPKAVQVLPRKQAPMIINVTEVIAAISTLVTMQEFAKTLKAKGRG